MAQGLHVSARYGGECTVYIQFRWGFCLCVCVTVQRSQFLINLDKKLILRNYIEKKNIFFDSDKITTELNGPWICQKDIFSIIDNTQNIVHHGYRIQRLCIMDTRHKCCMHLIIPLTTPGSSASPLHKNESILYVHIFGGQCCQFVVMPLPVVMPLLPLMALRIVMSLLIIMTLYFPITSLTSLPWAATLASSAYQGRPRQPHQPPMGVHVSLTSLQWACTLASQASQGRSRQPHQPPMGGHDSLTSLSWAAQQLHQSPRR